MANIGMKIVEMTKTDHNMVINFHHFLLWLIFSSIKGMGVGHCVIISSRVRPQEVRRELGNFLEILSQGRITSNFYRTMSRDSVEPGYECFLAVADRWDGEGYGTIDGDNGSEYWCALNGNSFYLVDNGF